MARKPMVTRTMKVTKCVVLAVEISTSTVKEIEVSIPRTYKPEKLLKAVQEFTETDEMKIVSIKSVEVIEQLYGMSEEKFMEVASILPPRGTKESE